MPNLIGSEVRHRAAELAPPGLDTTNERDSRLAQPHLLWLSEQSGIPVGTIHNATRNHSPQGMSLPRIYALAAALRRDGEDIRDVVAAITATDGPPQTTKPSELAAVS